MQRVSTKCQSAIISQRYNACFEKPPGVLLCMQVHRLARRLRVPVKDKAWAVIGFETGTLPALPSPSPTKPAHVTHTSPPLLSPLLPQQAVATRRVSARHAAAAMDISKAAKKYVSPSLHTSNAAAADGNGGGGGMHRRAVKGKKHRRVEQVIPESEQQAEEDDGVGLAAHPAGPHSEEEDDQTASRGGRAHSRNLHRKEEQDAQEQVQSVPAGSVIVADSLEVDDSMVGCSAELFDEVSSADTGHRHRPGLQMTDQVQPMHHPQQQQQAQPQQPLPALAVPEQGRAVGGVGQVAEAGQLLRGEVQWLGPSVEPPAVMGSAPSQHQTYYSAFSRVSQ